MKFYWRALFLVPGFIPLSSYSAEFVNYERSVRHQMSLNAGYSSLNINKVAGSAQSFRPNFDYFVSPRFTIDLGYLSMPDQNGQMLMSGYDVGSKIFLFSSGTESLISGDGMYVQSYSNWSHYLYLAYCSRTLYLTKTQIAYAGLSLGYGLNWNIGRSMGKNLFKDLFSNFAVYREGLKSKSSDEISIIHLLVGMGVNI